MSQQLTFTAFLSILIFISGSLKIPSPVAGGEFQLSAPIAVLICAYFGFKRYFTAGIIASLLGLIFGTANIFNILIAMIFRIVAGGIISFIGPSVLTIALSGPIGTAAARVVMGQVLQVDWLLLVYAAVPGMIFTAVTALLLYRPGKKLLAKIPAIQKYLFYNEV